MAALSLGDILASTADLQPKPGRLRSARSQNRAAAWAYDLAQWREYRLAMAKSPAERAQAEQDYADRLEEGPDFAGYHVRSDFSEPHRHQIDSAGRQAILQAFDRVREWQWRNLRKPRGQAVSKAYREVLAVLTGFAMKFGQAFPCQATIARMACCSESTVRNALRWLRMWGFLDWKRRLKRVPGPMGSVTRQTSNAYIVALKGLAAIGARLLNTGSNRNNSRPSGINRLAPHLFASRTDSGTA